MSPEACQDLSWHRAVAETDETPFWSACSQSDGPARGRRKDNREKSRPLLFRLDQMPEVSTAPLRLFHRRQVWRTGQVQDANLQRLHQWVSTTWAAQSKAE